MKRLRRKKKNLLVPVVSMGDIAFLLIIFFILVSNFTKDAGKQFDPALARDIRELDPTRVMIIIDEKGKIWLDNHQVASPDALEGALSDRLAGREEKRVQLKIDREMSQDLYLGVIESIAKAGGKIDAVGKEGDNPDEDRP